MKTKRKPRPSGVSVRQNRNGTITMRSFGPNAPDLRDVVPGLLAGTRPQRSHPTEDDECRTCLGGGRIRDGETRELRRCLDCGGSGLAP